MLKLGISRCDQLERPRTIFGARKFASLLLLKDLRDRASRNADHYNAILRLLLMSNGTWKDTFRGRFEWLDAAVMDLLAASHPPGASLTLTDLGASSGVTSVEFYEKLRARYRLDFLATDLWRDAVAIRSERRGWVTILDARGSELQYVLCGFVLPGQGTELPLYPVNRALRWLARRIILPRARSVFGRCEWSRQRDFETARLDGFEVTRLPLLSAECLDVLAERADFRFHTADILEPLHRPADVIRAMNIITSFNFKDADLRRALRLCLLDLKPHGWLIIGRSPTDAPRDVAATIYREDGGVLRVARRLNAGCEIEPMVQQEHARLQNEGFPQPSPQEARS